MRNKDAQVEEAEYFRAILFFIELGIGSKYPGQFVTDIKLRIIDH
ncbi:MAG TPA: hypothetical protein VK186_13975 [Candidatus Deferrimicrobium sp.]|nr:hypothetical protein [Candidatus Deferrimicrobium sp.]